MNRLQAELHRLYLAKDPQGQDTDSAESGLVGPEGRVRAMVLELARPADWDALSTVWQGLQTDLELPAPAIAVSGIDGYQLWLSLAEPTPAAEAHAFLDALRLRYLGAIASERIRMLPALDASAAQPIQHARWVPAQQKETGHWSAFVAPGLAAVLADDPWLDMPPGPEAQADLLARLECIEPADFQRASDRLGPAVAPDTPAATSAPAAHNDDPKRFLLAVMSDRAVDLHLRIEAAKALLPYFEARRPG